MNNCNISINPFKVDEDLEHNSTYTLHKCLEDFVLKGGNLISIPNLSDEAKPQVHLNSGDAVYPICSGGFCRSQALWAILHPFSDQITLFPPHAARHGWDPYNGQINRFRNRAQEDVPDDFSIYFGKEKAERFGFENSPEWGYVEQSPTREGLAAISQYYDRNYFGPGSSWEARRRKKRFYVAFSSNAHIVIYRLNQTNNSLKDVTVVSINSEDLITYPPPFLETTSRSTQAYQHFTELLKKIVNLSHLFLHDVPLSQSNLHKKF
jgi:hypothetical protein